MEELEREMKTRVRTKGSDHDRETSNMVWADFLHFTARPVDGVPDPHLHMHAYAMNLTYDEAERRFKAGQFGDLKRDAPYWEAAFDARLAHRLNTLGIATEKRGLSFEVAGVQQSVINKFSRRRDGIEQEAAAKGITDAKGKHAIGYYGREHKNNEMDKNELREEWSARLSDQERAALTDAVDGRTVGDKRFGPEEAKEYALAHSFQNASAVSEKKLKAEALKYGVGSLLPEDVADISQHPEVISEIRAGQKMTTTKTMLNHEIAFLQFAKDGQRTQRPLVGDVDPDSLKNLSHEQRTAALHILKSRDTVTGGVGKAGTGKTTAMRTVRDVIESQTAQRVFAFAPSSQTSRNVLAKEGFKDAQTLEMLLRNERMQEQTKGQILWLDEAGQVSSVDMRRFMDLVKRNGCRAILTGDYAQHSSVEAGDAFRLLEQEAGVKFARLTEIRRQKMPGYRKAVEAISDGTGKAAQKGFDAFDKMGWIQEIKGEERHAQLVKDYVQAREQGASALIVSPTHAEADRLTKELRERFKAEGSISKERTFKVRRQVKWSDAQKADIRNYEAGMVVDFHEAIAGVRKRIDGERKTIGGFKKGEAAVVVGKGENGVLLLRRDGTQAILALDATARFQVSRPYDLSVGRGDRIRITKNGEPKVDGQLKGAKVSNGTTSTRLRGSPRRAISGSKTEDCCRKSGAISRLAM